MGQLKNPKLKGISIFHPIKEQEFSGKVLPGGIFLGRESFNEFAGGVVFYDESRELSRILGPLNSIQSREIKTRGLTPHEVTLSIITELRTFMEGCDPEFGMLEKTSLEIQKKIFKLLVKPLTINFYLGAFTQGRPPEMLIVNDGVVKWLVKEKKIKTYSSDLAYVNWSAKILHQMPKDTFHVAIQDSGRDMKERFVQTSENISFVYPGSLIPGLSQLRAFLSLFEKIQR